MLVKAAVHLCGNRNCSCAACHQNYQHEECHLAAFVGAEISGRVAEMVPFIGKRCIEWLLKMGVS